MPAVRASALRLPSRSASFQESPTKFGSTVINSTSAASAASPPHDVRAGGQRRGPPAGRVVVESQAELVDFRLDVGRVDLERLLRGAEPEHAFGVADRIRLLRGDLGRLVPLPEDDRVARE